jgi:hypothetical protein
MRAGRLHSKGIEQLRHPRKVGIGVVADDARQLGERFRRGIQDQCGGARSAQLGVVLGAGEKTDLVRPGALQRADLPDQNAGVAGDASAELRRDLRERERAAQVIWRRVCWVPAP